MKIFKFSISDVAKTAPNYFYLVTLCSDVVSMIQVKCGTSLRPQSSHQVFVLGPVSHSHQYWCNGRFSSFFCFQYCYVVMIGLNNCFSDICMLCLCLSFAGTMIIILVKHLWCLYPYESELRGATYKNN